MGFLTDLLENSTMPWLTALLLGLMTSISPCPLAMNITAVGFISRDIDNRNRVFVNGLLYTLGRAILYTTLALLIFFGADQLKLSGFFQQHGEKIVGPLLVIIGLLMLDVFRIKFPALGHLTSRMQNKKKWSYADTILLGFVFALAFCPYSGVLYFGMLIPMSLGNPSGMYLPVVYALATGIPVIIFAWLIAYTFSGIGTLYNKLRSFELWFRRMVAVLFIGTGIYYIIRVYV